MIVKLGTLATFKGGSAFPRDQQGHDSGVIPFMKVSDLSLETGAWRIGSAAHWLQESQLPILKPVIIPARSTVFAKIGEGLKNERCRFTTRPTAIDNNMMAAMPKENVYPHYLYYLIKSIGLSTYAVGSALPYLKQSTLTDIAVNIPSRGEQQAIAEVLGALDDKIAANTKLSMISEDLAVSLLRDCPVSVPVGEIVTYKKGSVNVSALGAATVAHFSLPAFDSGRLPDLCDPNEIKSNKALVQTPSVLISKLNPRFPRVWDLPELPREPAVASTEFLVLEPKFSSTSVLWSILSQEQFKRELETQVAGTSGSHQRVKPADLLATKTIDPRDLSSETQHLITALCNISFQSRYENRQLATTRDALLPQLLSGKLRVKEAAKVVEDAL